MKIDIVLKFSIAGRCFCFFFFLYFGKAWSDSLLIAVSVAYTKNIAGFLVVNFLHTCGQSNINAYDKMTFE